MKSHSRNLLFFSASSLNFFFFIIFLLFSSIAVTDSDSDSGPVVGATPLIKFLQRVQVTALKSYPKDDPPDPKNYIDLSLKPPHNLSTVESAFNDLTSESIVVPVEKLKSFINEYLDDVEHDLDHHNPEDFVSDPVDFLVNVKNELVREWALEVHGIWKILSYKVKDSVRESPERHTLLPVPEPFIIPGSRFRETYYWDSYWVIKGLRVSKMLTTAKRIVRNLMYLVKTYGYALNGARTYYTNRSHPPLLSSMVCEVYNATQDEQLLKEAIPVLLKEYQFWNSGKHKVVIRDANGHDHVLSRFYAFWNSPRFEATLLDEEKAFGFSTTFEKQEFYRAVSTACESGIDFSTRWMRTPPNYTTIDTTSVVPVDLNVFLLKMEVDLAFLLEISGNKTGSDGFLEAAEARKRAFEAVFWNEDSGQWLDYWLSSSGDETEAWKAENQNRAVYASNFAPIWLSSFNADKKLMKKVVRAFKSSGLVARAGILSSLTKSSTQWDYPNGWAPQQDMIVTGLARSGLAEAKVMAEELVRRWVRTSYRVYYKTGKRMPEKLDVTVFGSAGGGGFYTPQTGFGWSNGVILAFLEEFGWPKDLSIEP